MLNKKPLFSSLQLLEQRNSSLTSWSQNVQTPHTIKDVYVPNEPFQAPKKWKYFSIQHSAISETAFLFFKVPMLNQFDILVRVECRWTNDEQSCATLSIIYVGIYIIIAAEWYQVISNSVNKNRDKKMASKLAPELLTIIALCHIKKKSQLDSNFPPHDYSRNVTLYLLHQHITNPGDFLSHDTVYRQYHTTQCKSLLQWICHQPIKCCTW